MSSSSLKIDELNPDELICDSIEAIEHENKLDKGSDDDTCNLSPTFLRSISFSGSSTGQYSSPNTPTGSAPCAFPVITSTATLLTTAVVLSSTKITPELEITTTSSTANISEGTLTATTTTTAATITTATATTVTSTTAATTTPSTTTTTTTTTLTASISSTVPPSPKNGPCVDEGPTVGLLEPEMFVGEEEAIVVPSEPDTTSSPVVLDASILNEERTKFQFSANHNNVTFHRRFPQVDPEERLINYYSCAFHSDILLQGYLYITENYFAFYSNILGLYKTKLLIPICDVRDITKEKTAIIIPNAVGIETHEGKYVFGSLLSRETTYRLMVEVWKNTISMDTFPYGNLRVVRDSTDNGNSSPSTPTVEEPLNGIIHSKKPETLRLTPIPPGILPHESSTKSSSLNRSKASHRSKSAVNSANTGDGNCDTGSSDFGSDLNSAEEADEETLPRLPFKLKPINSVKKGKRMLDNWSRFSLTVKSFSEKLKSDLNISAIHFIIIVLLIYLLISTICMIHRITTLQDLFTSLTSNPKAQRILNNWQVERIKYGIKENMVKIDDLKSSLVDLLASIERISNNCLIQSDSMLDDPQVPNICPLE